MPKYRSVLAASAAVATLLALGAMAAPAAAETHFKVTNLVSDGFVPAPTTDASLVNPWGLASAPTGPFWVADNGAGVSTLYKTDGTKLGLTVNVAPPGGPSFGSSPTGIVFNGSSADFHLTPAANSSALFMFATEDGTISGWSPNVSFTNTVLEVDNSMGGAGAVYKGLAIGANGGQPELFASNFRSGQIEVYNSSFSMISSFTDPNVAAGFAPFGAQVIGDHLFVTFALQDDQKHDDVAGAGNGYVDEFNLDGTLDQRIVSQGGQVNSPWGLAIAPSSFGTFAGDLLVGNFGDGTISAFNLSNDDFMGKLSDAAGNPIVLGDLWGLINGNGGAGGDPNRIYFSAGIVDEAHGLFGSISAVPEPSTWSVMIIGAGLIGTAMRRRKAAARLAIGTI
jgi:uncharacterized protein (TIGR03118 family)